MTPPSQWTTCLVLTALLAAAATAQPSYPPLVQEGEILEDVGARLADVSRRRDVLPEIIILPSPLLFSDFPIAFSPDGKTLASTSDDRTVRLWNLSTGEMIRPLEGHADWVVSVAFSPDGKTLASASLDRTVRLWNVPTGEIIRTLRGHVSGVRSAAFSPDGKTLASTSLDRTVRLWNVSTGEMIRTLERSAFGVRFVDLSPDGKTLASASYDRTVRLWNVSTVPARHRAPPRGRPNALVSQRRSLGESQDDVFLRLRSLSEEGLCHFILAGFWHLYEAAALDYQSPLRNFGETLTIGALEDDACVALATRPMKAMGLTYEDAAAVERLVERTGGRANLIAAACNEVLKSLGLRARTITSADVDAALASPAVADALAGWTQLAGEEDESRLDRVLVYATVERGSFTLAGVLETLAGHGHDVDADRVERSLKRLELAWVVGREGASYTYRVPLFVERLRAQEPSALLRTELKKLV